METRNSRFEGRQKNLKRRLTAPGPKVNHIPTPTPLSESGNFATDCQIGNCPTACFTITCREPPGLFPKGPQEPLKLVHRL